MTRDDGSIVLGWLTKLVIALGAFGLLSFDGISLLRTTFNAADQATTAAAAAADDFHTSHDLQKSYNAALAAVAPDGDTIDTKTFSITTDGRVHLVLHRTAPTLWLEKIRPLRHLTDVHAAGDAGPGS